MRIRTLLAGFALAGGALVAPTAAQAVPPPCHEERTTTVTPGVSIRATAFWVCPDDVLPLPVTIKGFFYVWGTVATGDGEAVYHCPGTALRAFQVPPQKSFTAKCH